MNKNQFLKSFGLLSFGTYALFFHHQCTMGYLPPRVPVCESPRGYVTSVGLSRLALTVCLSV